LQLLQDKDFKMYGLYGFSKVWDEFDAQVDSFQKDIILKGSFFAVSALFLSLGFMVIQ
jgi:hypothetical protein